MINKIFSISFDKGNKHIVLRLFGIKFSVKVYIEKFLDLLTIVFQKIIYAKNIHKSLFMQDFSTSELTTFLPTTKDDLKGRYYILKDLSKKKLLAIDEITSKNLKKQDVDLMLSMGYNHLRNNILLYLNNTDIPYLTMEEGFLRSITMHGEDVDEKYEVPRAFFLDDLTFHFNATMPSRLECLLNDTNLIITEEQKQESRKLIEILVSNKLTKYNHQPIYTPQIGRENKKKVLVIEQALRDTSIYLAKGNDKIFNYMLKCAIKENPDADIIIKTHPEQVSGRRGGIASSYYAKVKQAGNIYPINLAINPYSLLEIVDDVYVCSSMMGFEAALMGKNVHCFGIPSYSNWGFTDDRQICRRRKNKRTIEEFVYILYFLYTKYVDDDGYCSIWEVIETLLKLRDEFFEEYNIRKEL